MSNIQLHNQQPLHPIIRAEQEGVKLKEASNREITNMLTNIIVITGIGDKVLPDPSKPTEEAYARALFSHIRELMGNYTSEEVILAFKLAVKREFTANMEIYGKFISVNYLMNVVSQYQQYKQHNRPRPESIHAAQLPEATLTEEDIQKKIRDGFVACYMNYVKHRTILNFGSVNYKIAKTTGLFDKFGITKESISDSTDRLYQNSLENKYFKEFNRLKRETIRASMKAIDPNDSSYKSIMQDQMLTALFEKMKYIPVKPEELTKLLTTPSKSNKHE